MPVVFDAVLCRERTPCRFVAVRRDVALPLRFTAGGRDDANPRRSERHGVRSLQMSNGTTTNIDCEPIMTWSSRKG